MKSKPKLLNPNTLNEYEIGCMMESKYVASYVSYESKTFSSTLLMHDIGGAELTTLIPVCGYSVNAFMPIAIKIVRGILAIHKAGIIHRDIGPHNIIYNPATTALNIIDFDVSSPFKYDVLSFY